MRIINSKKAVSGSGFTLIELMIVSFVFTIIMGALFIVLNVGRNSWQAGNADLTGQAEVMKGVRTMTRELRQTTAAQITGVPADGSDNTSISFTLPTGVSGGDIVWSGTIQYLLDTSDANDDGITDQILRSFNGSYLVVANEVSGLTFSRNAVTPNLLEIEVQIQTQTTAGQTRSIRTRTQIYFRN